MIDVRRNHLELMTDSNRTNDSAIRFYSGTSQLSQCKKEKESGTCDFSSNKTWSYSLSAVQKMMDVTDSKQ